MARFGEYDSNAPAPQMVIGWYDEAFNYSKLPPEANRIIVSDEQWQARAGKHWQVNNGQLEEMSMERYIQYCRVANE